MPTRRHPDSPNSHPHSRGYGARPEGLRRLDRDATRRIARDRDDRHDRLGDALATSPAVACYRTEKALRVARLAAVAERIMADARGLFARALQPPKGGRANRTTKPTGTK